MIGWGGETNVRDARHTLLDRTYAGFKSKQVHDSISPLSATPNHELCHYTDDVTQHRGVQ
jgi:hypothetical protein